MNIVTYSHVSGQSRLAPSTISIDIRAASRRLCRLSAQELIVSIIAGLKIPHFPLSRFMAMPQHAPRTLELCSHFTRRSPHICADTPLSSAFV